MSFTRRSNVGASPPRKIKVLKENEFYDGTHNNANGFFFSLELPMLEGALHLIEEYQHRGRKHLLQTILWTFGIELDTSCFFSRMKVKDPVVISSIIPKSPAEHDGRLKASDIIVSANGSSMSSLSSTYFTTILKNSLTGGNLQLKVFRHYGASEDTAATSSEPLLGAQFSARILQNPKFSDVVFAVGNERIQSYRVLVADKSPVFEAMLTHDMTEKKTGIIKIEGFEPAVFRSLLNFIYTDKLEFEDSSVADLMELARAGDFYDVKGLKENVFQRLPFLLTKETAVDILMLARNSHFEDFTDGILTFIAMWSTYIMQSDSFSALEKHPGLLVRVMRAMSDVRKDDLEFLLDLAKAKFNARGDVIPFRRTSYFEHRGVPQDPQEDSNMVDLYGSDDDY